MSRNKREGAYDRMGTQVEERIRQVYSVLLSKPNLRPYIDTKHRIPEIYCGEGQIKLIIVGQDPTVKNKASRRNISTVLNLDKQGKMQRYIYRICSLLDVDPETEIYATNLFKNFFEEPPGDNREILSKFCRYWLPLLLLEIEPFKDVPVITFGDAALSMLFTNGQANIVRNYWGYHEDWKNGFTLPFSHCCASENVLNREVFPFPHQPSIVKDFYADRLEKYVEYMREKSCITELMAV